MNLAINNDTIELEVSLATTQSKSKGVIVFDSVESDCVVTEAGAGFITIKSDAHLPLLEEGKLDIVVTNEVGTITLRDTAIQVSTSNIGNDGFIHYELDVLLTTSEQANQETSIILDAIQEFI